MIRVSHILICLVFLILVLVSPFSVFKTIKNSKKLTSSLQNYSTIKSQLENSKLDVSDAERRFSDQRDFEISYNDVTKLVQVLNNVASVTVTNVITVNPREYFTNTGEWSETDKAKAVTISLTVEDTVTVLKILDKMQLPLYSLVITEPNIVNVTFLTGGES